MSKSYKKYIKLGVCHGSNTEYYRAINRKCRRKNYQMLHNLISKYDIDIATDLMTNYVPIHNSWDEPTDGTFIVDESYIRNFEKENGHSSYFDKYKHMLKSDFLKKGKYKRNIKHEN